MQSNAKEKIVEELVKGRESANQIRILLNEFVDRNRDDLMLSLDDLSGEILASLNSVFSILNDFEKWRSLENDRANSFDSKSKISEIKQRRGCYKRRRNCESWTMESACLENDGYAWRKYGQKVILNAKHPRNYYRCTHKFDKGCEATKQVQKISDDPPLYRIIYHNNHTCKIPSQNDSSFLLSFNSIKTEVAPQPRHEHPKPSDHILASPDRTALEASGLICGSDVISGEVYSSTGSSHGKEVDYSYMMMDDGLFDVRDDGDDVFRLLDYDI